MRSLRRNPIVSRVLVCSLSLSMFAAACAPGIDPGGIDCSIDPTATGCIQNGPTTPVAPAGDAGDAPTDAGTVIDPGTVDAGTVDAGTIDAGTIDPGTVDAGTVDAGSVDAGSVDAGSADAGTVDAGAIDAGTVDAGSPDAGDADGGGILAGATAPSTYSAYAGTDYKAIPAAPNLGPANYSFNDPVFGSRILRVTDQNTHAGQSLISTDAGFHRTFNADSTAIKLSGPDGFAYWLEFNGNSFSVGDGSSQPAIHQVPFAATWEWSALDPDIIYFLNGAQIAKYNKATKVTTNLGGPSTGEPATYDAVVIGADKWVCSAAGAGIQDTYTKFYCVRPSNPSTYKFVDVANKTINGVAQTDPNWPVAAAGQTLGIHSVSSSTGSSWLEITFHQQSWGANGGAVFDLDAGTWSTVTNGDYYWSGHVFMGNGKYINASGSKSGTDSRGLLMRSADSLMDASQYLFFMQPPTPSNSWCDADHTSWFNSMGNPGAPVLQSRYNTVDPSLCKFAWTGEIVAGAVDGSNKVWRFAHNHNSGQTCYYAQSFAQISNDGKWALFSSPWEGTLGAGGTGNFGCASRIDTFLVELK